MKNVLIQEKYMNKKKIFVMLLTLSIFMVASGEAVENTVVEASPSATLTSTPTSNATEQPVQTAPGVPSEATTAPVMTEQKFRVGPTVKIRPVNDVIKKDQDGLVELYMDNPSLNDVTLTVDAHISVPAGIHVSGEGFGEAGAAGTVYGVFTVPPGKARTIYVTIKAEKVGDFSAQFSGTYYPGDNKDAYQPMSLTHPFTVLEASSNPNSPGNVNPTGQPPEKAPGISAASAIIIISLIAYRLRR